MLGHQTRLFIPQNVFFYVPKSQHLKVEGMRLPVITLTVIDH